MARDHSGDGHGAVADLERIVSFDARNGGALREIGRILDRRGDLARALEYYEASRPEIEKMDPDHLAELDARIEHLRAQTKRK